MAEIKLQKRYKYVGDIYEKLIDIGFDIQTAPRFLNDIKDADVVEVVRCKDCKQAKELPSGLFRCKLHSVYTAFYDSVFNVKADDFCSYGERKE